jgi:hypothetical protein
VRLPRSLLVIVILLASNLADAAEPSEPVAGELAFRTDHRSISSIVGGISLVALGGVAVGAGGFFMKGDRFGPDCWSCSPAKPFGLGVFLGGVASVGIGVPLVVSGARSRRVPAIAGRAELFATGSGASLAVHF